MDVTHFLFFVLATLAFIGVQWLFSAWYGGYRSLKDFYRNEIRKGSQSTSDLRRKDY